jgi:hypothetical protein
MSAQLDRVKRYRKAARLATTAEADVQDRYLALLELVDMANEEPDPLIGHWARIAIWTESKAFLGVDDEEPEAPTEPYEAAQRKLRSRGFSACPACLSPLADETDFHRWRALRQAHIDEIELRERAVDA